MSAPTLRPATIPPLLVLLCLALAPAALATSTADPEGDTFGSLAEQLDVVAVEAETDGVELLLEAFFAGPISPAGSGEANAVGGLIDLDTDQNVTTGFAGAADAFSPFETGLGVDHFLDLGGYSAETGDLPVLDAATGEITGRAPVSFGSRSFLVTVPLSLLGDDDGAVDAAVVVGTASEATDVVPNGGFLSSDDTVVRLNSRRFRTRVDWRTARNETGSGHVLPSRSDDSALFWFFRPGNWELLVKVLDGCPVNGHYWVFAAATTNVEYTLRVTDTETGAEFRYSNPLGTSSAALTETKAFATCP